MDKGGALLTQKMSKGEATEEVMSELVIFEKALKTNDVTRCH